MDSRTNDDRATIDALARDTGFTTDAVAYMMDRVAAGGGRMAQFDHPEFGGSGQWMHGAMLMLSDWSDTGLRERVARLCEALAAHGLDARPSASDESLQRQSRSANGLTRTNDSRSDSAWWPAALGHPATSGSQNDLRYAWFPETRRLAIGDGDSITLHDTGDHRIGGVSQQQGGGRTLAFTSQHGVIDLAALPVVNEAASARESQRPDRSEETETRDDAATEPFQAMEKLAALHARGILTDDEYARKKTELLDRI